MFRTRVFVAVTLLLTSTAAIADPEAGRERYLKLCSKCHGKVTEQKLSDRWSGLRQPAVVMILGPNLSGIMGRPAGQIDGYRYSKAFRQAAPELVWDEATMDRWITDSKAMLPGTFMLLKVPDAADRQAVIDYLKTYARYQPQ